VDPDESALAFYDGLADDYDALFDDWWTAAQDHGAIIDQVLRSHGLVAGARMLDCACGIGTQALSLAALGYDVTGTDISPAAVERAAREAAARGIAIAVEPADMRALSEAVAGPFDAVIACDNSVPHLLDDADLDRALVSIHGVLGKGGLLLASIRDYDQLRATRPSGTAPVVRVRDGVRTLVGQAWEWHGDDERMRINLFVLRETAPDEWTADVHTTWYRALTRATFTAALERNGFTAVQWLTPDESGYYQPIVTARSV
jgi:glycine/sarcosine N-methyltransferase